MTDVAKWEAWCDAIFEALEQDTDMGIACHSQAAFEEFRQKYPSLVAAMEKHPAYEEDRG